MKRVKKELPSYKFNQLKMVNDTLKLIKVLRANPNCHIHYFEHSSFTVYTSLEDFEKLADCDTEQYDTYQENISLWDGDIGDFTGYIPEIVEVLLEVFKSGITTSSE